MKQGKRMVYLICFTAVMLMDWTRGAFYWETWATSTNLVGLILAALVAVNLNWQQEKPLPYVLWGGAWLLGSGVGFFLWKQNPGTVFMTQYLAMALSIGALGIVAIRLLRTYGRALVKGACYEAAGNSDIVEEAANKVVNEVVKCKLDWKKSLPVILWIVMSVLMVCSPLGELWQLHFLLAFGLFYLLPLDASGKREMMLGAADGTIIAFFIIQIWAFGFRPYDVVRYSGAYNNCNINSLFYVMTYVMLLYRLHDLWKQEKKNKWQMSFYILLAAALVGFVLLTMTRTALLAVIGLSLVFVIFESFIYRKVKFLNLFRYLLGYLFCVMLLFPCVYGAVRYLPTILHHPVWWGGEYAVEKVHSFDPWNSDKYVSFDEVMDQLLNRVGLSEEEALEGGAPEEVLAEPIYTAEDGELLTGDAAKSSMRIRLAIYEKYLKNLNFRGHELEEGYMPITETFHAWHAQNVFIQVLFYYGIPAGILFLVLMAITGVKAWKAALRNREEGMLLLLVWLLFIGYGMMECVWYPGQSILFFMYFVFRPGAGEKTTGLECK